MKRAEQLKHLLVVVLGFVAIYVVMVLLLRMVGLEQAQQLIREAGPWAPVLFVGLCVLSLMVAPLSGSSLFIVGGALFGKEKAFLLSLIGSLIGCSLNFWISKKLGRQVVGRLVGHDSLNELDRFTGQINGHRGVFYLMLILPISQDIVSYAAGLTPISYSRFAVALIVSATLVVAAYIYLGSSLLEALL